MTLDTDNTQPKTSVQHLELTKEAPMHSNGSLTPPTEALVSDVPDWPQWRKNAMILLVSFHSMTSVFMAAGIIPGAASMAKAYGVTLHDASYLVSVQIVMLGIMPLLWVVMAQKFGNLPILILSPLVSMVCNIGGAECHSYGAQMVTRALTAAFISPPIGIGSGIVAQLSTPEEYARKLGWWVLLTILGTSAGPLIMGFVVQYTRVEFIYWIFAGMNLLLALGYVLLGIETRRAPEGTRGAEDFASPVHSFAQRLRPRRIDPRPIKASDFVVPLRLVKNPRILMSALATTVSFCYANIVLVVEMPIAFGEKFHLDAQATGLQFIPVIIGCVIGEQVGGPLSDYFMKVSRKRNGHVLPGHRLWLTYIGFATIFAGLLVWGFQLEHSESWNVTPCIGVAIASFGNQIQSTILTAYAIDSSPRDAANVGVFFNLTRLLFGFTGPFYFPYMFESLGFIGAAGLMCGLVVIGGLIPVVVVHAVGSRKHPSDNA